MKSFLQFIIERNLDDFDAPVVPRPVGSTTQSLPPKRANYTNEEDWKRDTLAWAAREKAEATADADSASLAASVLGAAETGAKAVEKVSDTTMDFASVVPGGNYVSSAYRTGKAGINAAYGDTQQAKENLASATASLIPGGNTIVGKAAIGAVKSGAQAALKQDASVNSVLASAAGGAVSSAISVTKLPGVDKAVSNVTSNLSDTTTKIATNVVNTVAKKGISSGTSSGVKALTSNTPEDPNTQNKTSI